MATQASIVVVGAVSKPLLRTSDLVVSSVKKKPRLSLKFMSSL